MIKDNEILEKTKSVYDRENPEKKLTSLEFFTLIFSHEREKWIKKAYSELMSNNDTDKPYFTDEDINSLLENDISIKDFEKLIGFEYGEQGYIYKSKKIFSELKDDEVCYIPEYYNINNEPVLCDCDRYTKSDFLNLCDGNIQKAEFIYYTVDWQHPEVLYDEVDWEEEFIT